MPIWAENWRYFKKKSAHGPDMREGMGESLSDLRKFFFVRLGHRRLKMVLKYSKLLDKSSKCLQIYCNLKFQNSFPQLLYLWQYGTYIIVLITIVINEIVVVYLIVCHLHRGDIVVYVKKFHKSSSPLFHFFHENFHYFGSTYNLF